MKILQYDYPRKHPSARETSTEKRKSQERTDEGRMEKRNGGRGRKSEEGYALPERELICQISNIYPVVL